MRSLLFAALWTLVMGGAVLAGDAGYQWSGTQNPSGSWSYGWAATPGASFQPFTTATSFTSGLGVWSAPNGASLGLACVDVHEHAGTYFGGHPGARAGSGGSATVLRWSAPEAGSFHVAATFASAQGYLPSLPGPEAVDGNQTGAGFGNALAVGDVNGDGFADVVVGQPSWNGGQLGEGRALLYLGSANGWSTVPAWTFESNVVNSHLGTSVAVGDFNGDGNADIVAGAPGAAGGTTYFFRGTATLPVFATSHAGGGTGFMEGTAYAMADFDGDGFADVVVSVPGDDRVYFYKGNSTFTIGTPIPVLCGFGTDTSYGRAVVVAGDVNADGLADLLVSEMESSTVAEGGGLAGGRVFLFLGSSSISGAWNATWNVAGMTANARMGSALSAAGDVDHDGYADFLIASRLDGSASSGQVQLFRGGSGALGTTPAWTLTGASGNHLGASIATLGDANGDGYGDFFVGTPNYTNGQANEGRVQLFLGGASAIPTAGYSFESNQAGAMLGTSTASGDVNGDRTRDLVAGAPGYFNTVSQGGRAYLIMDAGPAPRPACYVDVRLLVGGLTVSRDTIDTAAGRDTVTLGADVAMGAGGAVDVEISDLDAGTPQDLTRLDVVVEPSSAPTGPQGPVFALGGQRFVPVQGVKAFEALAYDPLAGKFASNGFLYGPCGEQLSAGPEGPGIAWDAVTRKFWNITFNAVTQSWVVASWDTTTHVLATEFSVPRLLSVPGTGPDTLEDARGLAIDSSFVYLVDAGPLGIVPPANAWFKFTRAGVSVASLKGAAFSVNSFGDIADDVVYAPFASPTEPGRLLVAVEHVGIVVLATNGALVDTFTWRVQGVEPGDHPVAFAGLAIDPGTGDLFLADNDRALAQHWVRLTEAGPTSYLLGDGNPMVLQVPAAGCDPSVMWEPLPPKITSCQQNPFIFGIAYRGADQGAYAIDYGDGTLWRFDPRTGRGVVVGPTNVIGVWGLAYDTQRDRLYGLEQGSSSGRVWSIDPRTAKSTPLPNLVGYYAEDIAFEPIGGSIYGVSSRVSGPTLIRIDRDTGVGTAVGPTRGARGLDYDPLRGALLGINSSDSLWSINPGTGAASLIAVLKQGNGWEGLAVVPVAPFVTTDVTSTPGTPLISIALAAYPQPAHDHTHLSFALTRTGDLRLEVFDVAGRLVRGLAAGRFTAGVHDVEWDGHVTSGRSATAGVYFARLSAEGRVVTTRVVLTR